MLSTRKSGVAAAAVLVVALAGCSSSSKSGGSTTPTSGPSAAPSAGGSTASSPGGALKTIKIGVLTDITGPAASGNKTAVDGVKAGAVYAARQGYKIEYVVGDTATNPATALSASQKLVTQDHVSAVIAVSALTLGGAPYLTAHNVPVIGAAQDGAEWQTAKNMFGVTGAINQTIVTTTLGDFFKSQGVTTVGTLGYGISPLSAENAKGSAESARHAGLKVGYVNSNFAFGSTDVQPVALGMKKGGVDGFTSATDPNTSFALIVALRQAGVDLKVALLPTGYGGDTLQAGPGALTAAQNVYFGNQYEVMEMNTTATKQFASDLKDAGITTAPTLAEYHGYASVGLLVRALKADNGNTSAGTLISTLSGIKDWDGLGLFGGRTIDLGDRKSNAGGVDNCLWVAKLEGSSFRTVPGADPVCGKVIAGVTVSGN
ncbi:MAG TPA: ABC transporter substrate-binding protein [Frankiaceae bacterium]|jgi:branched-chain amino acid transport system substrate-binding protein|nr:ABC transporter substrate-binding protein [Frankiaceae bacterium]